MTSFHFQSGASPHDISELCYTPQPLPFYLGRLLEKKIKNSPISRTAVSNEIVITFIAFPQNVFG